MQSYTHFTLEERESLRIMASEGKSIRAIAKELKRNPSSISRELSRNKNKKTGQYNAWGATSLYLKRRKRCVRPCRCETEDVLRDFTAERLRLFWSPETIAAVWKLEHPGDTLAHTTIYAALRNNLLPGCDVKTHLRRRGRRKYVRGATTTIKPDRFIVDRCEKANKRSRIGDWEGDIVLGGVGKGCLLTCVDRKSRYLLSIVSHDKSAVSISAAFHKAFNGHTVHTLTLDNGPEFALFKQLERELNTVIYFCDPHAPWQRGTNENINGILRFFFRKGTDFRFVSQEMLDDIVTLINQRPRKCLGWLSPADIFFSSCCT